MITPTTPSSLLDIASGTVLETQVYKPHAACVQVVLVAPDGRYKVVHEWELLVADLVAQNREGETLPDPPKAMGIQSRQDWETAVAAESLREEADAARVTQPIPPSIARRPMGRDG